MFPEDEIPGILEWNKASLLQINILLVSLRLDLWFLKLVDRPFRGGISLSYLLR